MNQSSVSDSQKSETQTDLTPCFDTQKEWFEHTVKSTSKYQNLVFIHGERLFIMENGQYKIAAVQLAWEIHQEQQKQIDELNYQDVLYRSERGALVIKCNVMKKDWQKMKDEKLIQQNQFDELQKRVDQQGLIIAKVMSIASELQKSWAMFEIGKKLEQALKGSLPYRQLRK